MKTSLEFLMTTPGEQGFVVALSGGGIYIGQSAPEKPLVRYRGLERDVESLSLAADGETLIASDATGKVAVWDIEASHAPKFLPPHKNVNQVAVISKKQYLTVEDSRTIRIWSAKRSDDLTPEVIDFGYLVESFAVREDKDEVAFLVGLDVILWDLAAMGIKRRYTTLTPSAMEALDGQVVFSPNGRFLLIYWDDGAILETEQPKLLREFPYSDYAYSAAISNCGQFYALGTPEGRLVVRGQEEKVIVAREVTQNPISQLDFAADGRRIAFLDTQGAGGILNLASDEVEITDLEILNRIEAAAAKANDDEQP